MSFVTQTIIQLTVGLIAFLAGFFIQRIRTTWAYFRARRFWRPLLRRDLALVLGDGFPSLETFEATNMIGRGDLVASYELTSHFSRMGFRRLQPVFADKTVGAGLTGQPLQRNLIILGGPDANVISHACLTGMRLNYTLVWPDRDNAQDERSPDISWALPRLVPAEASEQANSFFSPSREGNEIVQDYGVIIRSRNPLLPWDAKPFSVKHGKRVVIIYGCYGYGTLAAVLYAQTPEFLKLIKNSRDDVECIVSCRVIMGTPQAIGCVYFKAQRHGSLSRLSSDESAHRDIV